MKGTRFAAAITVALAIPAASCKDKAKESEKEASTQVVAMAELANRDIGEIERGLPVGAQKLSTLWAKGADPHQDLHAVRSALLRIRRDVPDLTVAKSTFFALADDKGVAIRNDLEEDAMAGKDLVALFPDLAKVLAGSYGTTTGRFPGPELPSGPDKDWLAAAPIKKDDGSVGGMLVTGWTYRRFAFHLEETLRHDMQEAQGNGKLPIVYVMVFDASGAYGTRQLPPVNAKAASDLDLETKTANGPAEGVLMITDREFGWAAMRLPKMRPDAGMIVLRSEL